MPNALKHFGSDIEFCKDEYDAAMQADAIVLITEWKQFRHIDFLKIIPHLKQKVFFDGRNQYQLSEMQSLGMQYFGIGTPSSNQDLSAIVDRLQAQIPGSGNMCEVSS